MCDSCDHVDDLVEKLRALYEQTQLEWLLEVIDQLEQKKALRAEVMGGSWGKD